MVKAEGKGKVEVLEEVCLVFGWMELEELLRDPHFLILCSCLVTMWIFKIVSKKENQRRVCRKYSLMHEDLLSRFPPDASSYDLCNFCFFASLKALTFLLLALPKLLALLKLSVLFLALLSRLENPEDKAPEDEVAAAGG